MFSASTFPNMDASASISVVERATTHFPSQKNLIVWWDFDESRDMLAKAKESHKNIAEWRCADAKLTELDSGSCDARVDDFRPSLLQG